MPLERWLRIVADLATAKPERLERLRVRLLSTECSHYHEFTPRGLEFAYPAPQRRTHLAILFEWLTKK